ncbi:hypothetical protein RDI58_019903 [Solanum bulbocastanum]|uniref:Uncharacterized protein n=1 Tax=Solanum bulbocastanum TaxID=147425 RepID=A0AAN8TBS4_SOLBU
MIIPQPSCLFITQDFNEEELAALSENHSFLNCFCSCSLKFSILLLPADASSIQMTRSEQKKKRPCLSNTNAEMKFNRRKKYKEMPANKETLLVQRRTRVLESTRCLLQVSAFNNSVKSLSSTSNSPFTSTEG